MVVGAGPGSVGVGEAVGVTGEEVAVCEGAGLGSTAKAAPVRPGPVNNETASRPAPKDVMIGRRD